MWLLRKSHKHINQETLSEHLDGRLQGRDLERVEQRLEECDACRQELAELQATVAMMRQLPMETPRRSFVMSAPPLESPRAEPARARPALVLRAPNWVYAGAASVAALALAVTISVDATGGLSSDPLRREVASTASSPTPTAEQVVALSAPFAESASGTEVEGMAPPPLAATAPTVATAGDTDRESAATGAAGGSAAQEEPEGGAGGGAPAQAFSAPPMATPAPLGTASPSDLPTSMPTPPPISATAPPAQDSRTTTMESVVDPEAAQTREPITTSGDGDLSTVETEAAKALTVEEPTPVPERAEPMVIQQGTDGDTSIWWRVLEAAAGVVAVAFLAAWLLRRRVNRRDLS
ncbi:MAG: zf-HC2 domain-containing protein [Dehalococcoidia bacterium]